MMERHLISLSGNVGVGKSTIGPYIAEAFGAHWLSESSISSNFSNLFADESKKSRRISQITFSSLRVATILSSFLGGATRIISERTLWDSLLFHELWEEKFALGDHDFFERFYKLLSDHSIEYTQSTIRLVCPVPILLERIKRRNENFDNNHTEMILYELERKYEKAFSANPPSKVLTYDVSTLNDDETSLKRFADTVKEDLQLL